MEEYFRLYGQYFTFIMGTACNTNRDSRYFFFKKKFTIARFKSINARTNNKIEFYRKKICLRKLLLDS